MVDPNFRIINAKGMLVNEVPLLVKTQYGADRIMWRRQYLHSHIMKVATSSDRDGPRVTVRTNALVKSCCCGTGTVTLQDGEVLTADFEVETDGIYSNIRNALLGEQIIFELNGTSEPTW
jgi:salicylate hydroxylase